MGFVWVCIGMIVVLGIIAAVANRFDKGNDTIEQGHDCSTCTAAHDDSCKLHCLMEEAKERKEKGGRSQGEKSLMLFGLFTLLLFASSCSTKNNNAQTRWWHSFNAKYNTYYNGQLAFTDGNLEKEKGNQDNYTEILPL